MGDTYKKDRETEKEVKRDKFDIKKKRKQWRKRCGKKGENRKNRKKRRRQEPYQFYTLSLHKINKIDNLFCNENK